MRVVLFLRSMLHGGTERQAVVLARALQQRGHDVLVATLYDGDAYAHDLASSGIQHESMGKRGRYDLLLPHLRLVRLVRRWRADLVYSFLPAQNIAVAALAPFFGSSRLVMGVRAARLDVSRYDWLARFSYRFEGMAARRAGLVIANSEAGAQWCLARGFPKDKLKAVPNGIELWKFRIGDDVSNRRARGQLGVREDAVVVALIGRLDVMKDHPNFLRAAALLSARHPAMVFACIGNGPHDYTRSLKDMADGLGIGGRIIWCPALDGIENLIGAVDVVVLSSAFGEGFPNVVAEAMACGIPPAVTDVGDCRAILDGLLPVAPPRDPAALAAVIEAIAAERQRDAASLARRLRARIEQNYSETILGEKTERLLAELLGSKI